MYKSKGYGAVSESVNGLKETTSLRELPRALKNYEVVPESVNALNNQHPVPIGGETWTILHRLALDADTREKSFTFCVTARSICEIFPCPICSSHAKRYIVDNPPEDYVDILALREDGQVDPGVFLWTWKFHNSVNLRIGKPLISYESAISIHSSNTGEGCTNTAYCV